MPFRKNKSVSDRAYSRVLETGQPVSRWADDYYMNIPFDEG
jgi:hypothetical protein